MRQKVTVSCRAKEKATTIAPPLGEQNPKELLLCSAAQCALLTLRSIIEKERITPKHIDVEICGDLDTPTVTGQSQFTKFYVTYRIECNTIDEQDKIGRAVRLTNDKYCGLIQMLRRIAPLSHEVSILSVEAVMA